MFDNTAAACLLHLLQLLGDSFSVTQQPPIRDPCSHYSMLVSVVENCGSLCKMFFTCPHLRSPGAGAGCIWRWLMMFPASGPHYPVPLQRRGCQQTSAASISKVNQYEPRAAAACGWRVGQLCPAQSTTGTAGGAWYLVWTGAAPKNRLRM